MEVIMLRFLAIAVAATASAAGASDNAVQCEPVSRPAKPTLKPL